MELSAFFTPAQVTEARKRMVWRRTARWFSPSCLVRLWPSSPSSSLSSLPRPSPPHRSASAGHQSTPSPSHKPPPPPPKPAKRLSETFNASRDYAQAMAGVAFIFVFGNAAIHVWNGDKVDRPTPTKTEDKDKDKGDHQNAQQHPPPPQQPSPPPAK